VAKELERREVRLASVLHAIAMDKTIRGGAVTPLLDVTREELMGAMDVSNAHPEDLALEILHLLALPGRSTGEIRHVDGGDHIRG
jgi:enoyl-[acyl-carrier-protein] reductase (NADH)